MQVVHSEPVMAQQRFPVGRLGYLLFDLQQCGIGDATGPGPVGADRRARLRQFMV